MAREDDGNGAAGRETGRADRGTGRADRGTGSGESGVAAIAAASVPWRSRTVQVVVASTALAPLGVPLVSPALPVVRDAFGVTDAAASLLVSAYFLTGIVLSPFIGLLADRVGRRAVLVPSLFAFSVLGASIAFVDTFAALLAIRFVQGTAAAGIFITTVTLVGDAFEGVQRNAVLGVTTAALATGAAVFPLVGGALATVAWNAPFYAYLLGLPVALFALVVLREPERTTGARGTAYLRGALASLGAGRTYAYYVAAFSTEVLLFGTVLTALPFLLAGRYDLSPVLVGGVLTAAEVAAAVVASQNGRLARRFSDARLVALGFLLAGAGLVVAWLAPSLAFVVLGVVAVGASTGLTLPSVDAGLSGRIPGEYRGAALSLRNSATFLGRATGPVLFAGLALYVGYDPLLLAGGVVALLGGGIAFAAAAPRHERPRARRDTG